MLKVILTHLGCFDLKPLLTDPPHKSSNWFCHCQPQALRKGFGVKVKALPHCQSCWQPAQLKAPSNADDQRDSLLMGSAPTVTGAGKDSNWDQHFFILVYGREKKKTFQIMQCSFLSFWQLLRIQVALPENSSQVVPVPSIFWLYYTVLMCPSCTFFKQVCKDCVHVALTSQLSALPDFVSTLKSLQTNVSSI